jgi:vitamin K-dependent gamma-carboxylase
MTATDEAVPLAGEGRWGWLLALLNRPRDAAGLAAFRVLFGALALLSVVRFWSYGWIDELYVHPSFHFTYYGFGWVEPWPPPLMYVHFALMGMAALGLCVGIASRASALLFCLTFTYAELIEKASYLNHYYFVSLAALLLASMPCGAAGSVDAWWRRRRSRAPLVVRTWCYWLLRAQLAILYFFAGFAKLDSDWLLSAQPLGSWLALHADAPLVGPWLATPAAAYFASYAGAAFDLSIPLWLSLQRTRPYAYLTVIVFHVGVWLLFPIGMFSWVMIVATTIFFDPGWPRRFSEWRRARLPGAEGRPAESLGSKGGVIAAAASTARSDATLGSGRLGPATFAALAVYLMAQLTVPLRYVLYPGNVNWHEQGFRFAWRVMLVEKAGQVEFTVLTGADDRRFVVYPRERLTPLQYKMMSTQPDMIQEFARSLRQTFLANGYDRVRVYADAWVSMNGRPRQRLIDPRVDLAGAPWSLAPSSWILPLQNSS